MKGKVLSVEIGSSITKAVYMDIRSNKVMVRKCFCFKTPDGVFEDGAIKADEIFGKALEAKCSEFGIQCKNVSFVISANSIASRIVEIPYIKEKKIEDILMTGMDDYFPVDISLYKVSWKVIGQVTNDEGKKKLKVNITVIPNELLASYKALAKACSLNLVSLDTSGNSLYQISRQKMPKDQKGMSVILNIDSKSSFVTILDGTRLEMQRSVPYGIEDAVYAVRDGMSLTSYADAMDLIRHKTCIKLKIGGQMSAAEEAESTIAEDVRSRATEALRPLMSNISRTLTYYISQNKDAQFERIYLVGDGADFSGLTKLMTNEFGQKITPFMALDTLREEGTELMEATTMSAYASCIGSGISPLDILVTESASDVKKSSMLIPAVVSGFCLSAIAGMLVFGMLTSGNLASEKARLTEQIATMKSAANAYSDYSAAEDKYKAYSDMYQYTSADNGNAASFVSELEEKLPNDVNVTSFSIDKTGIAMTMTAPDKVKVAAVIERLRTFDSVTDVTTTGIAQNPSEDTASLITFSVMCSFVSEDSSASSGTSSSSSVSSSSTSSGGAS